MKTYWLVTLEPKEEIKCIEFPILTGEKDMPVLRIKPFILLGDSIQEQPALNIQLRIIKSVVKVDLSYK